MKYVLNKLYYKTSKSLMLKNIIKEEKKVMTIGRNTFYTNSIV